MSKNNVKNNVLGVRVRKRVNYSAIPEQSVLLTKDEFVDMKETGSISNNEFEAYYVSGNSMSDCSAWKDNDKDEFTHVALVQLTQHIG